MDNNTIPWWRNRTKLPAAVFFAIGAYFLFAEHRAHVIEFLPWLLILGCVGMHLFMHGGHNHGSSHAAQKVADDDDGAKL